MSRKRKLLVFILILFFLSNSINCARTKIVIKRGIMDNINNGIKFAGQMLGINTAADVAELVAKTFAPKVDITKKQDNIQSNGNFQNEDSFSPVTLINGILKLMGLDTGKLGALAINGLVFLAQMITNALGSPRPSLSYTEDGINQQNPEFERQFENAQPEARNARSGSPIDWILSNPSEELSKLLINIRDKKLPDYLTNEITKLEENEGDGTCVKQLLCKISPIIWGMQKSIGNRLDIKEGDNNQQDFSKTEIPNNTNTNRLKAFFEYLPTVEEFKIQTKFCEEQYNRCNLTSI